MYTPAQSQPSTDCKAGAQPPTRLRLQRLDEALPEAAAQLQQRVLAALRLQPAHHLRRTAKQAANGATGQAFSSMQAVQLLLGASRNQQLGLACMHSTAFPPRAMAPHLVAVPQVAGVPEVCRAHACCTGRLCPCC